MNDEEYYSEQFRVLAGYLAAFFSGFIICLLMTFLLEDHNEGKVEVSRDTIYDTIVIEKPLSIHDTIVKYVKKNPIILHDTTYVLKNDTELYITPDTQVVIPITQKVYEDSTYKAWVSGYLPSLDKLEIYRPTITITKTEYKRKAWSWGLQGGAGIDVITNKPVIYIGLGANVNM